MPKKKDGTQVTWKEFFSLWREGIEGITPEQKLKVQLNGTILQIIGIFLGIVMSIINFKQFWWIGIILIGAFMNTVITYIGIKQQINAVKKYDEGCEEMSMEDLFAEEAPEPTAFKEIIKTEGGK